MLILWYIRRKLMSKRNWRIDALGRAYAGSQRQIQTYVSYCGDKLSSRVTDLLGINDFVSELRWVSPLESEIFREYRDAAFLKAVGLQDYAGELREFWPRGGPSWDALAIAGLSTADKHGVVLVEAKSYTKEMYGNGCQATPKSRAKIEAALNKTKQWLCVDENADWTGPLYQYANRLAHLYFLREVIGVDAWLVNIYFVNDPRTPTTEDDWRDAIAQVKSELGLPDKVHYSIDLFLPAKE